MQPTSGSPIRFEKLARMANQIASFFRAYPEQEAHAGIRDHIQAFWTPAMRQTIQAAGPAPDLDPLVIGALHGRSHAESPILKERAGPETVGQLASDAG